MGIDNMVHLSLRQEEYSTGTPEARIRGAVVAVAPSLFAATVTTVAVFACFGLAQFSGLSETGYLAAIGLTLGLVITLVVYPAWCVKVGARRAGERPVRPVGLSLGLPWLALALARRPGVGRFLAVFLVAACLPGLVRFRASGAIDQLIPETLPPRTVDRSMAVAFDRARERVLLLISAAKLQAALRLNDLLLVELRRLHAEGQIAEYRSLAQLLPAEATQRERFARLSARDREHIVSALRAELSRAKLKTAPFEPFLAVMLDPPVLERRQLPAGLQAMVDAQLKRVGEGYLIVAHFFPRPEADLDRVFARLNGAAEGASKPIHGQSTVAAASAQAATLRITGTTLASRELAEFLQRDLAVVSAASIAVVAFVVFLLLRRVWWVIAVMLSLMLEVVIVGGVLGWAGVPFDLYTFMVLPILIGYGVDDHIYIARRAAEEGMETALRKSGPAVLVTTLTTMAAFGALALCGLPGLRALGLTAMLGLAVSMLSALLVLPALLGRERVILQIHD
jgi:predicted RND superfamily exporter protein